jgi:hypothetical protein
MTALADEKRTISLSLFRIHRTTALANAKRTLSLCFLFASFPQETLLNESRNFLSFSYKKLARKENEKGASAKASVGSNQNATRRNSRLS